MIIELSGTNSVNFGAQLMLDASLSALKSRRPDIRPSVFPTRNDFEWRSRKGLLSLLPGDGRKNPLWSFPIRVARLSGKYWQLFQERYGVIDPLRTRALFDMAGFRLSDQWGPDAARRFSQITRAHARRGNPVVLLPQAFGPFREVSVAQQAAKALDCATLIFARDAISAEHLRTLRIQAPISIAPDFTMFGDNSPRPSRTSSGPVTIVPNARLIDRPGHDWTLESYISLLQKLIRHAVEKGYEVQLMMHTLEDGDMRLARLLSSSENLSLPIVRPDDAKHAKDLIADSWVVIGSRYHALASALGLGRPALAIGWSHKYRALFEDMGVANLVVRPGDSVEETVEKMDHILDVEGNSNVNRTLNNQHAILSRVNEQMWSQAIDLLPNGGGS